MNKELIYKDNYFSFDISYNPYFQIIYVFFLFAYGKSLCMFKLNSAW